MLTSSTPGAPLFDLTRFHATQRTSERYILSYSAPNFRLSDCFAAWDSLVCNNGTLLRTFIAPFEALMLHYRHPRHDRSTVLRSSRIVLSLPSSLQDRSDFPASAIGPCGSHTACTQLTVSRSHTEIQGSQVQHSYSFTACHWPYPGSSTGACALCFPVNIGLLHSRRRSACILPQRRFVPHPDSPS